jgi:hypothetical protein
MSAEPSDDRAGGVREGLARIAAGSGHGARFSRRTSSTSSSRGVGAAGLARGTLGECNSGGTRTRHGADAVSILVGRALRVGRESGAAPVAVGRPGLIGGVSLLPTRRLIMNFRHDNRLGGADTRR